MRVLPSVVLAIVCWPHTQFGLRFGTGRQAPDKEPDGIGTFSVQPHPHVFQKKLLPFKSLLLALNHFVAPRSFGYTSVLNPRIFTKSSRIRAEAPTNFDAPVHLVWFTGVDDVRVHDHGGLLAAASAAKNGSVVPVFVFDPDVHSRYTSSRLNLLHTALLSLENELRERYNAPLVLRRGDSATVLLEISREFQASTCHVIADDVEKSMRKAQRQTCSALKAAGIHVQRWDDTLRPTSWDVNSQELPGDFPAYVKAISSLQLRPPLGAPDEVPFRITSLTSDSSISLADLFMDALDIARSEVASTLQPFDDVARAMGEESVVRDALDMYLRKGRDTFADERFTEALPSQGKSARSLYAAAAQRLLDGAETSSRAFALREAPTRAFSPALAVGSLSARQIRQAASDAGAGKMAVAEDPWWGRSSEGALADTVEWREWFKLLARRSLALQQANEAPTSGGQRAQGGDLRAPGRVAYWRWGGQYLVRYIHWEAGASYDGETPPMLFVHGFAASAEQWERLVYQLRAQASAELGMPADALPPMYAMDLLGFGHAEKPGLSYTQYLWEAQIVDFVTDVMKGASVVLCGNSIGGGLSSGAAQTLGPLCEGVVLCNTAGLLLNPEEYESMAHDGLNVTEATLEGKAGSYSPVPLLGQRALDFFGKAIVTAIYPQIEKQLANLYADRPANADPALTYAIQQGASSPGSANVIGSGQKLAPNRPLNEVFGDGGFRGPVLIAQGMNDRLSGAERARDRADTFSKLRQGITVERIEGGHCVHDDTPDVVARALLKWLPEVRSWSKSKERL